MSDNPALCLKYGNKIIMSKVLLGCIDVGYNTYYDSKIVNVQDAGVKSKFYVIKTEDQILPYCIFDLKAELLGYWVIDDVRNRIVEIFVQAITAKSPQNKQLDLIAYAKKVETERKNSSKR